LPAEAETLDHEFEPNFLTPRLHTPEQVTKAHVFTANVFIATQPNAAVGEDHQVSKLHSKVQRPNTSAL
jgi:hypothetical protein